jgi:hypothetical protein
MMAFTCFYDAIYTICSKSYSIAGGQIDYVDYQSATRYEFPIRHRRPIAIYELKVLTENILRPMPPTKSIK